VFYLVRPGSNANGHPLRQHLRLTRSGASLDQQVVEQILADDTAGFDVENA
jgi:hypothetical protein